MFDLNRRYTRPIIAPIVDQICTFQCAIPMGDLLKCDQSGHASPSGYGALPPPPLTPHTPGGPLNPLPLVNAVPPPGLVLLWRSACEAVGIGGGGGGRRGNSISSAAKNLAMFLCRLLVLMDGGGGGGWPGLGSTAATFLDFLLFLFFPIFLFIPIFFPFSRDCDACPAWTARTRSPIRTWTFAARTPFFARIPRRPV